MADYLKVNKKFTWEDIAEAANSLYLELNPNVVNIENPCSTIYQNNLPKMCSDVIVDGTIKYKSIHNNGRFELIAMALVQLHITGKIENI